MNLLIAGVIALGGVFGVSVGASSSLPGDILYPVKVHVNENMKHAMAFTSEQEANVSADIIATRAEEARALQAEGKLDAETKADLTAQIEAEMKSWNTMEQEMKDNGNTQGQTSARTTFDSQVSTNSDIFRVLNISATTGVSGSANTNSDTNRMMNGSMNSTSDTDTSVSATGTIKGMMGR